MIKILCDSISDLPSEIIKKYNIEIIPLTVIFNGVEYLDGTALTNDEFYKMLKATTSMPKTSQATYAQFKKYFDKYNNSDTEILYIGGSSSASGTFQSATIAKNDGYENVTLFDTQNLSIGSALFVIKACEMAEKGYSIEEIVHNLELMKGTEEVLFSVDTLEYLKMGGRISSTKASIGNLLNIKPILGVENGLVAQKSQVRGKKQIFNALAKGLVERYGEDLKNKTLIIGYGDNESDLEILKKSILEKSQVKDIYCVNIGCVVCSHSGPGILGVSCI